MEQHISLLKSSQLDHKTEAALGEVKLLAKSPNAAKVWLFAWGKELWIPWVCFTRHSELHWPVEGVAQPRVGDVFDVVVKRWFAEKNKVW